MVINFTNEIIFIDRNPRYFEHILEYLRANASNTEFKIPLGLMNTIDLLQTEATFFKLNS